MRLRNRSGGVLATSTAIVRAAVAAAAAFAVLAIFAVFAACSVNRVDGDDSGDADLARPGSSHSDGGDGCHGRDCQVPRCPAGQTTELTGRLFAGNGADPVPGATVFIPVADVPEFGTSLSCDACNSIPAAVASDITAYDGSFHLVGVPAGDFPLVLRLGRFQRVVDVQAVGCTQNSVSPDPDTGGQGVRLPKKKGELSPLDRLPRIAVASGDYDQIECVLKRIGIEELDMYNGRDAGTMNPPAIAELGDLLSDGKRLSSYDIVIVNCTDNQYESLVAASGVKANLEAFVASGGRLYVTDWAYDMIEQVPEFSPYICFEPQTLPGPPMCMAGSELSESADTHDDYGGASQVLDSEMAQWLGQFPGVINKSQQVDVQFSYVVINQTGADANAKSKIWVQGPTQRYGTRPLTVTFDYKSCGRVHFSTYNTEPNGIVVEDERWPSACKATFSPQERLLEYLFFNVAACVGPPG